MSALVRTVEPQASHLALGAGWPNENPPEKWLSEGRSGSIAHGDNTRTHTYFMFHPLETHLTVN